MTGFVFGQTRNPAQPVDYGRRNLVMRAHHEERQPVLVAEVFGFFVERRLGLQHGQPLIQSLRVFEAAPLLTDNVNRDTLERRLL